MRLLAMLKLQNYLMHYINSIGYILVAGTSVIVDNPEVTEITDEYIDLSDCDYILVAGTSVIIKNAEVTEVTDAYIDPIGYILVAGTSVIVNNAEVTEIT